MFSTACNKYSHVNKYSKNEQSIPLKLHTIVIDKVFCLRNNQRIKVGYTSLIAGGCYCMHNQLHSANEQRQCQWATDIIANEFSSLFN